MTMTNRKTVAKRNNYGIGRSKVHVPARIYKDVIPLLKKHAVMREISLSKLVNDILTIWLYQSTPNSVLEFFERQSTPVTYKMERNDTLPPQHNGVRVPDRLSEMLLEKKEYKQRPNANRRGFNDCAYIEDYKLPPFPKDMPHGYLRSIGYAKQRPLSETARWLEWAANDTQSLPQATITLRATPQDALNMLKGRT